MLTRRGALSLLLASAALPANAGPSLSQTTTPPQPLSTGAEVLAAARFAALAGKRIGLVTNQTGRVDDEHLVDLLAKAPEARLAAILAPEHGFRGAAEAGAAVRDAVDKKTGVRIFSLYGGSRKPTPAMLRNID